MLTSVEIALLGRDRLDIVHIPDDSEAALRKESMRRQAIIGRKMACVLGKHGLVVNHSRGCTRLVLRKDKTYIPGKS
jgi:hypothetical protein